MAIFLNRLFLPIGGAQGVRAACVAGVSVHVGLITETNPNPLFRPSKYLTI